jgi:hypothetical protein
MNRKLIIGKTFEEAMLTNLENQKISHREKINWIYNIPIISNPLLLNSSQLELQLFLYNLVQIVKHTRELTKTEKTGEVLISRLYNKQELQFMNDIFAIEFTKEEKNDLQILSGIRIWRIILLENIDDYEMRNQLLTLGLNDIKEPDITYKFEKLKI